jgi:hypothetical protein
MGLYFFDQYSLLHFAVGIIAYFWNVSLKNTIIFHIIAEIVENTEYGMKFINENIKIWPGGKPKADSLINSIGDTIFASIGWLCAYYLDKYVKN